MDTFLQGLFGTWNQRQNWYRDAMAMAQAKRQAEMQNMQMEDYMRKRKYLQEPTTAWLEAGPPAQKMLDRLIPIPSPETVASEYGGSYADALNAAIPEKTANLGAYAFPGQSISHAPVETPDMKPLMIPSFDEKGQVTGETPSWPSDALTPKTDIAKDVLGTVGAPARKAQEEFMAPYKISKPREMVYDYDLPRLEKQFKEGLELGRLDRQEARDQATMQMRKQQFLIDLQGEGRKQAEESRKAETYAYQRSQRPTEEVKTQLDLSYKQAQARHLALQDAFLRESNPVKLQQLQQDLVNSQQDLVNKRASLMHTEASTAKLRSDMQGKATLKPGDYSKMVKDDRLWSYNTFGNDWFKSVGPVTNGYNAPRPGGALHKSVDVGAAKDALAPTPVSGKVVQIIPIGQFYRKGQEQNASTAGGAVVIEDPTGHRITVGHVTPTVKVGDEVNANDSVGKVYNDHIHYQAANAKGELIDVEKLRSDYVNAAGSKPAKPSAPKLSKYAISSEGMDVFNTLIDALPSAMDPKGNWSRRAWDDQVKKITSLDPSIRAELMKAGAKYQDEVKKAGAWGLGFMHPVNNQKILSEIKADVFRRYRTPSASSTSESAAPAPQSNAIPSRSPSAPQNGDALSRMSQKYKTAGFTYEQFRADAKGLYPDTEIERQKW